MSVWKSGAGHQLGWQGERSRSDTRSLVVAIVIDSNAATDGALLVLVAVVVDVVRLGMRVQSSKSADRRGRRYGAAGVVGAQRA